MRTIVSTKAPELSPPSGFLIYSADGRSCSARRSASGATHRAPEAPLTHPSRWSSQTGTSGRGRPGRISLVLASFDRNPPRPTSVRAP